MHGFMSQRLVSKESLEYVRESLLKTKLWLVHSRLSAHPRGGVSVTGGSKLYFTIIGRKCRACRVMQSRREFGHPELRGQ